MNKTFQNLAKKSKVIVIKVGSNILVNEKFKLRKKWLNSLVDDVAKLQKKGSKIIIVSLGRLHWEEMFYKRKNLPTFMKNKPQPLLVKFNYLRIGSVPLLDLKFKALKF